MLDLGIVPLPTSTFIPENAPDYMLHEGQTVERPIYIYRMNERKKGWMNIMEIKHIWDEIQLGPNGILRNLTFEVL